MMLSSLLKKKSPKRKRKKKVKTKFIDFDHAGNDKLLNWLLWSLGWWLMLARRFCVFNVGLKVDALERSTMIMTSYYDENVRSCKRHTVVRRAFCFWRSLCPILALRLTTVSFNIGNIFKNISRCWTTLSFFWCMYRCECWLYPENSEVFTLVIGTILNYNYNNIPVNSVERNRPVITIIGEGRACIPVGLTKM